MKKKLFTLLVCAFAWIGVNATVEVTGPVGGLVTIEYDGQDFPANMSSYQSQLSQATSLKLKGGTYTSDNLSKIAGQLSSTSMTSLDLSDAMLASDATLSGNLKANLTKLTVPAVSSYTKIPAGFCNGVSTLTEIVLSDNITEIGATAFQATGITSITLPRNLQIIRTNAFAETPLTSLTIPGSVTLIETKAFTECSAITKVIFDEKRDADGNPIKVEKDGKMVSDVNLYIEQQVFTQATGILDVYIENTGTLTCENKAFDLGTTYGHGDATAVTATLHFPADKADDYVNSSGTPLTMGIAKDPAAYHVWLMTHFSEAQSSRNGWYEFRSNGTNSDEGPATPKFLKTYCDMDHDRMVPEGTKAYIVNGISKDRDNYKLSLYSIPVIPKGTGVILYGAANSRNSSGQPVSSLAVCYIEGSYPYDRAHWNQLANDEQELKNYLLPTGSSGVDLVPYEDVMENGVKVRYRNFIMSRIKSTDIAKNEIGVNNISSNYVGFFRVKPSRASGGKAYLHLNNTEYSDGEGMEAIVIGDTKDASYTSTDGKTYKDYQMEVDRRVRVYTLIGPDVTGLWQTGTTANPNMEWNDDSNWGNRSANTSLPAKLAFFDEPEFIPYEDGSATAIIPASMIGGSEKDVYFTPQGIRVSNPTSGLYIKNGKKVVVK